MLLSWAFENENSYSGISGIVLTNYGRLGIILVRNEDDGNRRRAESAR